MISRISNLKQVWQTVIGLEIHAQINSKTKLFSVAGNRFNSAPNSDVAFFDMATPGTLPIINGRCVELAIAAAIALKCEIDPHSEFDRKHYFYSDMPAGYQITQFRRPIASNGTLKFMWANDSSSKAEKNLKLSEIRIKEMHIEQDSGKSLHDHNNNISLVDLNRAGVGLLEIVTDPQFNCPHDAAGFVKELKDLLVELGICTGHMEQGALRVDANVSVKRLESTELGERAEVKNIGSIKGVIKAIEFESRRQISLLEQGARVINETRFYNPVTESTFSMRDKEVLQDYRYYPEPNLSPLHLKEHCSLHQGQCSHKYVCIQCARDRLENYSLPYDKRQLLISKYSLSLSSADTILKERDLYLWLMATSELVPANVDSSGIVRWLKCLGHLTVSLLHGELRARSLTASSCPINHQQFADYVTVSYERSINRDKLLPILIIMFDCPSKTPQSIIKDNQWQRISDAHSIEHIVRDYVKRHPAALSDYKKGKKKVKEFFKKNIGRENNYVLDNNILDNAIDCVLSE